MWTDGKLTPLREAFASPIPKTRRGQRLALISVILGLKFGGYGFGNASDSVDQALQVVTDGWGVPLHLAGIIGGGVCVFAWFVSYCHHGRDTFGYVALAMLTGLWGTLFAFSPFLGGGAWSAAQGALSYVLVAGLVLFCSGDPEPNLNGGPLEGCAPIASRVKRWRWTRHLTLRGRS